MKRPIKPSSAPPPTEQEAALPPLPKLRITLYAVVLLCGLLSGFLFGRVTAPRSSRPGTPPRHDGATPARSGPWGELERTPITIAAPAESLPIQSLEAGGTMRWFFKYMTPSGMARLMETLSVPASLREQLLNPAIVSTVTNGLVITPPCDLLFSLGAEARTPLYRLLAAFPETEAEIFYFPSVYLEEKLRDSGLSPETLSRFKKLSCTDRDFVVFTGLPCLLPTIPTYEEKVRLVKVLTRQQTMLLRLHVTSDSDINALAAYWGKACWTTDVKAILESLGRVPGGAYIDVIELLPPLPTSLLYTFPIPENPLNGPLPTRDCHWTSFNFFREPPDDRYSDPAYVHDRLKLDYYPAISDPRFGDVVTFSKPNGDIIHSAVFIADGIVFTKNGYTPLHPWILSTVAALQAEYSFQFAPGQTLKVDYFRNKYY